MECSHKIQKRIKPININQALNIQAYLDSGILEMYALDLLDPDEREEAELVISFFPEIRKELDSIQYALEKYADSQAILPRPHVKDKIRESIFNLKKEHELDALNLPLINHLSDHKQWLNLVKDFIPAKWKSDTPFSKIIQQSDNLLQMVIATSVDTLDEVHEDEYESFLILEGRCKCTVGQEVLFMEEGDFMAIPLHEHHTVELITDTVVAIVQKVPV